MAASTTLVIAISQVNRLFSKKLVNLTEYQICNISNYGNKNKNKKNYKKKYSKPYVSRNPTESKHTSQSNLTFEDDFEKGDEAKKTTKRKDFFMDRLHAVMRGGSGGYGLARYGGIGGDGGNVIIKASKTATLENIKASYPQQRFKAADGKPCKKLALLGEKGEDLVLEVPLGITVEHQNKIIGDLDEEGMEFIVAKGGSGGSPANGFLGVKGETKTVDLNLKLIADIGLVGFPNAGKSTFGSAVTTSGGWKIADYPFTTIKPRIAWMDYKDGRKVAVADLPGLIEGAWENVGMGHRFLKHIERTKLLLFLVDINGFQLNTRFPFRDPIETILILNREVEMYKHHLVDKPAVLALNKIDCDHDGSIVKDIIERIKSLPDSISNYPSDLQPHKLIQFEDILTISTKEGTNILNAKLRLREILDTHFVAEIEYPLDKWQHDMTEHRKIDKTA
ncbi:GTP-binding protein 10 homolog [Crassostrea angulata]|uniref:GTP-binding protein 10 n=1 Tax=Magallana gigas TaxID=29159 RepID=A0A8W8NTR8_MAGGI|nr:GTP-binding protein 10 homolog [Crassostrea gigas]XP_052716633.1 GTP-binding protein 10 homolog [Crassostrea angulata]